MRMRVVTRRVSEIVARLFPSLTVFMMAMMAGSAGFCPAAAPQDLRNDLKKFVETPAVPGYEQALGKEIRAAVAKWKPQSDSIGNVLVTVGSGSPHRLIATPMDEPGYVVSGITSDGFLRLQRLPQTAPNPVFDILYSAEPVQIFTRSGKTVTGVVAGLSTHLQGGRVNPPQDNNLDDVYVDIGATSAAEVHTAGVDVLDPLAIERHLYEMGYGRMTGAAVGDRFGCAALVEMLRHLDPAKVHGTLTVAFVVQQWAASRGIDRILQQFSTTQKVDEFVYVGRLLARRTPAAGAGAAAPAPAGAGGNGAAVDAPAQGGRGGGRGGFTPIEPKQPDGAGVLIGGGATSTLNDFASELWNLASKNDILAVADETAPLPRGRDAVAVPLPERFAHLSIATRWASTPGEIIDADDLVALTRLLELYAQGTSDTRPIERASAPLARPALPAAPKVAPTPTEVVSKLVEAYGVSTHEADVRALVLRLLPPWAKPTIDETGDVWVHLGSGTKAANTPRLVVVAHMDEIGFEVRAIESDGRLQVISRGGGIMDFYYAHPLLVHTANGDRPGVIELPPTWTQAGTVLSGRGAAGAGAVGGAGAAGGAADAAPTLGGAGAGNAGAGRGGAQGGAAGGGGARWNLDVGARSAAEVEQVGIQVGDWVTVPKKYRPLFGRRANGRSFDDRVGCSAAISAIWALGPDLPGRDVTFIFSTGEEIGLVGAAASAKKMAAEGRAPDYVFAIDTFVSSDSPLESKRFADAILGHGFVVRAVDGSNITPRELSDKVVRLSKAANIPVQYGVTGGGNDGSTFLPYGTIDIGMGWPLRYSHSPGEVIDTRDLDALAHILAVVAKSW
ncbi:MAG TPA: M20/M25/M40 family metallo-hydrolase [Candidatus Acidoferrales bacterium]|nr:M20/M25/M40 family metallo-hydrolase [Candidatus Acidoferrales bacterium]